MDEHNSKENDKDESSIILFPDDFLASIYDIVRAIFRHLPIRSVDSCSLVCQSWLHLSRLTRTRRHTLHTFTYPADPLSPTTTCSNLLSDFDQYITTYINNHLWSLPSFALVVSTNILANKGFYSSANSSPLNKQCDKGSLTRITERFDISQALLRHLNKSCKLLLIAADGIIASTNDNQSNEVESGREKTNKNKQNCFFFLQI